VAAWAYEIGLMMELDARELDLVCQAAELHHSPPMFCSDGTDEHELERLFQDLKIEVEGSDGSPWTNDVDAVLRSYRALPLSVESAPDSVTQLARILEIANYFDEQLEMAPLLGAHADRVFEEVAVAARAGLFDAKLVWALGCLRKSQPSELHANIPNLPVYPAVAIRAVGMATNPNVSLTELQNVCLQDQVLAGQLLELANSPAYSPRFPIGSVGQAVNYIGMDATRKVLATAAMKPLFASTKLRALWKHSLECAQIAEYLAGLGGNVNPREAFVAGLVHDLGRLAFAVLPRHVSEAKERLTARGCELLMAELVVTGIDHSKAGAEILKHWNVPSSLVEGVRYHHEPTASNSDLAAILYLTEFWADSEEDLPSNRQLSAALKRLSISPELLDTARLARFGALETVLK
ncbi:MAG TPA: HDOD domain-containing protein, partial [Bryobacteraceae bacterium]|nr:HDOD domain-containing protein [Bryobacteraceae bacterium]